MAFTDINNNVCPFKFQSSYLAYHWMWFLLYSIVMIHLSIWVWVIFLCRDLDQICVCIFYCKNSCWKSITKIQRFNVILITNVYY